MPLSLINLYGTIRTLSKLWVSSIWGHVQWLPWWPFPQDYKAPKWFPFHNISTTHNKDPDNMGGYAFFLLDPIPEWVKNILVSNFLPGHRRTVLPDLYESHRVFFEW